MKRKIQIIVFLFLCILQLYIISSQVYKAVTKRNILELKCRLYDPYDPLKGRYLALYYEIDTQDVRKFWGLRNEMDIKDIGIDKSIIDKFIGKDVYCIFSRYDYILDEISFKKPSDDQLFLTAKFSYFYGYEKWDGRFRLEFPFNKYYIQENFAPKAEKLLANMNQEKFKELNPTVVLLVDKNGEARIDRLEVKGISIEKYLLMEKQQNNQ